MGESKDGAPNIFYTRVILGRGFLDFRHDSTFSQFWVGKDRIHDRSYTNFEVLFCTARLVFRKFDISFVK